MAKSTGNKALGLALLVIGGGLAFWGYQQSESVGSQITQVVTGSHSDKVMMLLIGGAASAVVGLFLLFKR